MRRHRALASLVLFSSLLLGAVAHGQPAGSLGEDFIYRVRAGDTLINIANTYTRNSANWNPLQSLNKIVAPEQLPIGLELHIPLSMIPVRPAEARVARQRPSLRRRQDACAGRQPARRQHHRHRAQWLRDAGTGRRLQAHAARGRLGGTVSHAAKAPA